LCIVNRDGESTHYQSLVWHNRWGSVVYVGRMELLRLSVR
jgi:hypothetical protein